MINVKTAPEVFLANIVMTWAAESEERERRDNRLETRVERERGSEKTLTSCWIRHYHIQNQSNWSKHDPH